MREMNLKKRITQLVPQHAKLGFYLMDTKTNEAIGINENDNFPLASIAKFITTIFALEKNSNTNKEDILSAISKHCGESYKRLLQVISDEEINHRLKEFNIGISVNKNNKDKNLNVGNPAGIYKVLSLLVEGRLLNKTSTNLVLKGLEEQIDEDGFKLNKNFKWYHMTGGLDGVCNDIGYFEFEDCKVYVIGFIQTGLLDFEWDKLEDTLQQIGRIISESYLG